MDRKLGMKKISVGVCDLQDEKKTATEHYEQMDLFTDYDRVEEEKKKQERERKMQQAMLKIQGKYGKNAILKGTNLEEGATTIERNQQIGGHRA